MNTTNFLNAMFSLADAVFPLFESDRKTERRKKAEAAQAKRRRKDKLHFHRYQHRSNSSVQKQRRQYVKRRH